jgi:hypothetical protein
VFLQDLPPAMRLNLSTFLYGSTVRAVPIFRGLSAEVLRLLLHHLFSIKIMIILPRQARDKHGDYSKQEWRF